jgi:hypothetical protein
MESAVLNKQTDVKPQAAERSETSTIAFPYTDLDAGIDLVKAIHTVGGTSCDSSQLAAALNMEAKGGGFRLRITGAQCFGLTIYERGGRIALTDLGRAAVDPANDRQIRRDAFLSVELFSKVFSNYKGSPLPPPPAMERILVTYGVGEKVAKNARQVLMRSAKQAGFFELATDRLTEPPNQRGGGTPPKDEPKPPHSGVNNSGGDGGNSGGLHPLIQGLLVTLPNPGIDWPLGDRINWLNMAQSIFNAIYKLPDPDKEKKIAITGS